MIPSIEEMISEGRYEEAYAAVTHAARSANGYPEIVKLLKLRKKLGDQGAWSGQRPTVRLAILGGTTTDLLAPVVALLLESKNLSPVLYTSDFNTFAYEIFDEQSGSSQFKPDVVALVNSSSNISQWPSLDDSPSAVTDLVNDACHYWLGLCEKIHARHNCDVVMNSFHMLPTRPLGNLACKFPGDSNSFLRLLNLELGRQAPKSVHFVDVDALASYHGIRHWFDERYWYHAKQAVSFECLLPYARSLAGTIGGIYGMASKCLVVDLDNTLWGGVVGDDGVEGIVVGEGNAVGEAFAAFQRYLLQLKNRGVMLAVCSKNDEANALAAFEQCPGMLLGRDDFVAFKANWQPKPDNLIEIRDELNIGLDAMVFVDDNPAERDHVRRRLPEVTVIELSTDPADYCRNVDQTSCFEVVSLSDEDRSRTRQYHANRARQQAKESVTDYNEYLKHLEQRAVVAEFNQQHIDRITQLINKTNQFNLTTRRLTRAQVEQLMQDTSAMNLYVQLTDRFGDNGLISVFSAQREETNLVINQWLMSCRVLKRSVERLLLNCVVERARRVGVRTIQGIYVPTAKNGLVREHYKDLGFSKVAETPDGTTTWCMEVTSFEPFQVPIDIESN